MLNNDEIQISEKAYAKDLIKKIINECPRRKPTSDDELRALKIMEDEFRKIGISIEMQPFMFNDNLYANIALHFGLSTAGTFISGLLPGIGMLLHGLAAGSYYADSTRKAYILRRLLGFKPSQNLIATLPAKSAPPKLRVVIMSHADAAFTGLLFHDALIKLGSKPMIPFLKWPLALATKTTVVLTGFDALRMVLGPLTWPLRPLEYLLTIPSMMAFVLNMQMVIRNEIIPGANDNLSGTAALPILAKRLISQKPEDVELVFVVTGCEEASLGGSDALAKEKAHAWSKENTVIIGLDTLSNGDLCYVEVEGEVVNKRIPRWLKEIIEEVIKSEPRFKNRVKGFEIFAGGTDVGAFLQQGWDGVCLINIDHSIGAPRHYHKPEDTAENLDMEKLLYSIDFAEKLIMKVINKRLQ